jgi:hypothetical protein
MHMPVHITQRPRQRLGAAAMGSASSEAIILGALTEASGGNSRVSVSGASCDNRLGHGFAARLVTPGVGLGALCFLRESSNWTT